MIPQFVLASSSPIRLHLLQSAGLHPVVRAARIDEAAVMAAMRAEGAAPRDMADTLAELKARKVAGQFPDALVLGCDQVLALGDEVMSKPVSPQDAEAQLARMQGRMHLLLSAAVLVEAGRPVWRHVGEARMTMRPLDARFIAGYVGAQWDSIRDAVGCYKIEQTGDLLFSGIAGDAATIQGLPLEPLMRYLSQRGYAAT